MPGKQDNHKDHPGGPDPFYSEIPGGNSSPPFPTPEQIGRYHILELLGEGGCGLVYLAEQERPMKRRVALKVIKPGMDSKQVLARFEAERQALALLDHQNIARVFDTGVTETGQPYFVMEYVHGLPLTEHCDRQKLTIEERLKLFLSVCQAVEHAHSKAIIHRDLKPSNILVSIQGDQAIPKIIDFGIAKAVSQPLTESTLYTEQGQLIGTPEYMSPEQADLTNQDIDTRSDVYSLGVVLYELLTGVLPISRDTLRKAGIAAMRKVICEEDPKTPSTRLTALGDEAEAIALRRRTDIKNLAKRLNRELDWIPLKALRKDRTRRYRSASEFADDIENYLTGRPLIAGPESVGYRTKKFIQRRTGILGVALLILTIALLAFVVITRMYFSSQRQAEDFRRALYASRIALAEGALKVGESFRVKELLPQCPNDLRDWEWRWLQYASDTSVKTWHAGDNSWIQQFALNPNGTQFITGTDDGKIQFWDMETDHPLKTIDASKDRKRYSFRSLVYSPDGLQIASLRDGYEGDGLEHDIDLWDVNTSEKIKSLQGTPEFFQCIAFCPTSQFIVSGSSTQTGDGRIKLWNVETNEIVWARDLIKEGVQEITFSPDGSEIASLNKDKQTVRIWDTDTGKELKVLENSGGRYDVIYTPDGQRLITAGTNINIFERKTGTKLLELAGHENNIRQVSISGDGQYLVSRGNDRVIKLWNAHKGTELGSLHGFEQRSISEGTNAITPNGRYFLSNQHTSIKMWEIPPRPNPRVLTFHHTSWIFSLAFSPDSTRLVSASDDHTVRLWDTTTGQHLSLMQGHTHGVLNVCFSPDGKFIASASNDSIVRLWKSDTGKPHLILKGHQGGVKDVDWSPNGGMIASCGSDCKIRLWDVITGKETKTLVGHSKKILGVVFIDGGKKLVSAGLDGTVFIWDAHLGKVIKTLQGPQKWFKGSMFIKKPLAVSRDGRLLAVVKHDASIDVWDIHNWQQIAILKGHSDIITTVTFFPDNQRLISSAFDSIRLWDIKDQKEVSFLRAIVSDGGGYHAVAMSPNARYLAYSQGQSGTLSLADAGPLPSK